MRSSISFSLLDKLPCLSSWFVEPLIWLRLLIVIESVTCPPLYSMHIYGLLWDDLASYSTSVVSLLPFASIIGLCEAITCGEDLSSRNFDAFASIMFFFYEIIFFRQFMHSLVESLVYGRGGNDYLRDAESEDRLLLLLLFQSTEVTQVPHRATFYASAVILFLNMLVLV